MTKDQAAFPYPLVTTDWLAANLGAGDLKIVDASWRMPGAPPAIDDHRRQHIPDAVFFDLDAIADKTTTLPHMLPAPHEFAAAVGALGIGSNDRVIVYDDAGIFSAARVWWTFRAMGHEKVSVLDGGLPKWLRERRPLEQGVATPADQAYGEATPRPISRTADELRGFLAGRKGRVLDARPAARFYGEAAEPRPGLRRGRMPGATNIPHGSLMSGSGELKPAPELEALFQAAGVDTQTDVITTCGSGVTAAALSLALEVIGHRRHALYDGSWAEWGRETNDESRFPVTGG